MMDERSSSMIHLYWYARHFFPDARERTLRCSERFPRRTLEDGIVIDVGADRVEGRPSRQRDCFECALIGRVPTRFS